MNKDFGKILMGADALPRAAELLKDSQLVAIPTETVYGLAANAYDDSAVQAIFKTKNRPASNPLIVHLKSIDQLSDVAQNIPELAMKLAAQFWPGPLTLILEKKTHVSDWITAGQDTVAVRVPNHPLALALLQSLDFPLVAPSANRSNHISPTSAQHVLHSLGDHAPMILDGGICASGVESTILGFDSDDLVLYRHGAIPQEEIEKFTGKTLVDLVTYKDQGISPGSSKKHYAPKTRLVLVDKIEGHWMNHHRVGFLVFQKYFEVEQPHVVLELSDFGRLEQAAANLYAKLYELDQLDLDVIVAEKMSFEGLGRTINDRLTRAAEQH